MEKLRTSLVYLNARRYGLSEAESHRCALNWVKHFPTLFSQDVADQVYRAARISTTNFPTTSRHGILYVTAHFSAYTLVTIALARHFNKPIYIVVGTPPVEFEQAIVNSVARAGATAIIIRSDFSLLKNIRRAIDAGALVVSLIDVPWTRLKIPERELASFDFGVGKIQAIKSIFQLADRLDLQTNLVLCEPVADGFNIVNYGELNQQECFERLNTAVRRNPDHFERFCELHNYFQGGNSSNELVTFRLDEHRYCLRGRDFKSWKLSKSLSSAIESKLAESSDQVQASVLIRDEIKKITNFDHDTVIYI